MKIKHLFLTISLLATSSFATSFEKDEAFLLDKLERLEPGKYVSHLENFKLCKDMIVSVNYHLNNNKGFIVTSLDSQTFNNKALLEEKKQEILNNINYFKFPEKSAAEYYSVLNFYLNKNNMIGIEQVNPHLDYGKVKQVTVSCKEKPITKKSLIIEEKEFGYQTLFSQNL